MEINRKDVPKYLRKSEFYRNLDKDDDSPIFLKGKEYMKLSNNEFKNIKDLKSYFKTSQFWGHDLKKYISDEAIEFIRNNYDESICLLSKYDIGREIIDDAKSLSYNLNSIIKKGKKIYSSTIKIELLNGQDSLWSFEFNISDSFNFFTEFYGVIERNEEFNKNITNDCWELDRDSFLLRYIRCKYIKGIISFRFGDTNVPGENENHKDFIYKNKLHVPITKWNKSKILEQLKKLIMNIKELKENNEMFESDY